MTKLVRQNVGVLFIAGVWTDVFLSLEAQTYTLGDFQSRGGFVVVDS